MINLSNYPNLNPASFRVTSDRTPEYNCIAWAAGDTDRWWWPFDDPPRYAFWPNQAPREETLGAFAKAFGTLGYESCATTHLEPGYEKVAFFGDSGSVPKHAARQLKSGLWTSKIGRSEDIEHTLDGLRNSHYGNVILVMRRRVRLTPLQRAVSAISEKLRRALFVLKSGLR